MKKVIIIIISVLAYSQVYSQTTVSSATNTQTINYLTKWTTVTGTPFKIGSSIVYDNGSYVGIGTVVPGSKLHVNGNVTIGYSTSTPAPANGMIVSGNVGIGTATVGSNIQVSGNAAIGYSASTAAPANGLLVNGNIGLGTTTVGSKIQVNGNAAIGYSVSTAAPANGLLVSGNAGIGTTAPTEKLDLVGNMRINDSDIYLRVGSDHNHGLGWYGSTKAFGTHVVDGPVLYGYTSGVLGITFPQNKEILKWDSDFVRINAKVKALEFTAQTDVWSDYVFADDFKPMPLAELEKYLSANKHLPEIPSECEVIENGLNLGEMQNLQMKKIEELTLYIIELNKKNEALQKKVEALESKIQ
ncbi:MAG: hypothetical protein WCM76_08675 [Bacteroidota bacterium]